MTFGAYGRENMKNAIVVAAVGLMLIGFGMPASAYHIDDAGTPNGLDGAGAEPTSAQGPSPSVDEALSVLMSVVNNVPAPGSTVHTEDWWAGNTVVIDHPTGGSPDCLDELLELALGGGADCDETSAADNGNPAVDNLGAAPTGDGPCSDILEPDPNVNEATENLVCETNILGDPVFVFGLVICEFDDSGLLQPVASDGNAGYSGRCSSAKGDWTDDGTVAPVPCTLSGCDRDGDGIEDTQTWAKMEVTGDVDASCSLWDAEFFARVGNNAHGAGVASGDSFYYRDVFAYWATSGHITYFIDGGAASAASTSPPGILGCWGHDEHDGVNLENELGPADTEASNDNPNNPGFPLVAGSKYCNGVDNTFWFEQGTDPGTATVCGTTQN